MIKMHMDSIYLNLNCSQPLLQSTDRGIEYNLIVYKCQRSFKGIVCKDCFCFVFLAGKA